MADNYKADRLSSQFEGGKKTGQAAELEKTNLLFIEEFIKEAAEAGGILNVYRPIDERERAELARNEVDVIANAYRVETFDGRVNYITYKPQVERGKGSKLEHVNRSTPFVQMLLDKVGAEFSFLYCHSKASTADLPDPPMAPGFGATRGTREHLEGKNKYELFFLIECRDNIDASESMRNIIDSVLLDVDGKSGDFFSHMSYAKLERSAPEGGDNSVPQIDYAVQSQLNDIITQIRESSEVRQRILDFIVSNPNSEMHKHVARRDSVFRNSQNVSRHEVNALGSSVICRMMPIGVFLNAIDNDRIPYKITGRHGENAVFYVDVNPTTKFEGHKCPHCGEYLTADNGIVAVTRGNGYAVGCQKCTSQCEEHCGRYCYKSDGCKVCGRVLCGEHSVKTMDSDDRLCPECAKVFRDSKSGNPLSPADAAVRGCSENFVSDTVKSMTASAALNKFRTVKLLRKAECARCRTKNGYKYYLREETAQCFKCGDFFYRDDVRETHDTHEARCLFCRVDCSCGNVVAAENAHVCAEPDCTNGFCDECAKREYEATNYRQAVSLLGGKPKPIVLNGKTYCREHSAVCKVCGKIVPLGEISQCKQCGGYYCRSCAFDKELCSTCGKAKTVNVTTYKSVSSPTRLARLNALSIFAKTGKTAVIEDNENVVYVSVRKYGGNRVRIYNKLTGKTSEVK